MECSQEIFYPGKFIYSFFSKIYLCVRRKIKRLSLETYYSNELQITLDFLADNTVHIFMKNCTLKIIGSVSDDF
jgi:hypothetical protein